LVYSGGELHAVEEGAEKWDTIKGDGSVGDGFFSHPFQSDICLAVVCHILLGPLMQLLVSAHRSYAAEKQCNRLYDSLPAMDDAVLDWLWTPQEIDEELRLTRSLMKEFGQKREKSNMLNLALVISQSRSPGNAFSKRKNVVHEWVKHGDANRSTAGRKHVVQEQDRRTKEKNQRALPGRYRDISFKQLRRHENDLTEKLALIQAHGSRFEFVISFTRVLILLIIPLVDS
jgi:hypothetical protein